MNVRNIIFWAAAVLAVSGKAFAEVKNESEGGLVITGGNTNTQSYHVSDRTQYLFDINTLRFDGNYLAARQNGGESAENWMAGLRYEAALTPKFSLFIGQSVEGDKFAGYLQRYNTDLGAKYYFYNTEKDLIWFVEAGARYTHENDTTMLVHDYLKGRIYSEAEVYWAEATSSKLWVEYLPNFTFARGWLLNGELSVTSALNSIFSLKTAYLVRYNNAPPALHAVPTDTSFTTSLVAKF